LSGLSPHLFFRKPYIVDDKLGRGEIGTIGAYKLWRTGQSKCGTQARDKPSQKLSFYCA
jgi:hypothetical protein